MDKAEKKQESFVDFDAWEYSSTKGLGEKQAITIVYFPKPKKPVLITFGVHDVCGLMIVAGIFKIKTPHLEIKLNVESPEMLLKAGEIQDLIYNNGELVSWFNEGWLLNKPDKPD